MLSSGYKRREHFIITNFKLAASYPPIVWVINWVPAHFFLISYQVRYPYLAIKNLLSAVRVDSGFRALVTSLQKLIDTGCWYLFSLATCYWETPCNGYTAQSISTKSRSIRRSRKLMQLMRPSARMQRTVGTRDAQKIEGISIGFIENTSFSQDNPTEENYEIDMQYHLNDVQLASFNGLDELIDHIILPFIRTSSNVLCALFLTNGWIPLSVHNST